MAQRVSFLVLYIWNSAEFLYKHFFSGFRKKCENTPDAFTTVFSFCHAYNLKVRYFSGVLEFLQSLFIFLSSIYY